MMPDNYTILIQKLEEFIRKYYYNKLIRGGIYSATALFGFFICVAAFEYWGNFSIVIRTVLFYLYVILAFSILGRFIFIPLFQLFKIGKRLNYTQASEIIGKYFSDVKDRLLNTLQLKELQDKEAVNKELIEASINQKINDLKPIPFSRAIDIAKNKKYIKWAIIPLTIILITLVSAPSMVTEPTRRLINHATFYEKQAPFKFVVLNDNLKAVQQEDFVLDLKIEGDEIPNDVYLVVGNAEYRMEKDGKILFKHKFKNLQNSTSFYFTASGFRSKDFKLEVLPKPIIINFDVEAEYPSYVGKRNEKFSNTGDFTLPEGTKLSWIFYTKDSRNLIFISNGTQLATEKNKQEVFYLSQIIRKNLSYTVKVNNQFMESKDSLTYHIAIIPDAYPNLDVQEFTDSIIDSKRYFKGIAKDDYGFRNLNFVYIIRDIESAGPDKILKTESLPINTNSTIEQFYHFVEFSKFKLSPGQQLEYYFEVWDNDMVNGSKASRSQRMIFKVPNLEEIKKNTEKSNQQIKNTIEKSIMEAKNLQKEIEELNKKFVEKKQIGWQEKEEIKKLLEKQKNLEQTIENLKQQNQEKSLKERQYKEINENILEKQKQLEKLFEEIMTDELKEMFKELEKLMEEANKEKIGEMLDQLKLNNEDIEKQLDRNLELFKQLEFEKKMQETIEKIDKLQEEQQKLSEETQNEKGDNQDLLDKQNLLNNDFENLRKDLKDLDNKNKELQNPNDLQNTDNQEQSIQSEMKSSSEGLQKNQNNKASKSQKNAASQMKELSSKLKSMQESMEEDQLGEDIDALRDIMENLVKVSFDQETLMKKLDKTSKSDPKYIQIIQEQKKTKDDLQIIEDSLTALSKRQISVEAVINKEINKINYHVAKALSGMLSMNTVGPSNANQKGQALTDQQYVMTSVNNLALLLAEALQNMQQQMAQQKSGSGKACKMPKPGKGKGDMKSMRELQQQLNKQIQDLKNGLKPGEKPGSKPGNTNEQLARLAAQQEALRRMLQQYLEELKKEGFKDNGKLNKIMEEMEKTETDLVNKLLSNETLKRQEEILTRMLESEKAEKERELDNKRESNEAKNQDFSNPGKFLEYNKLKSKESEILRTAPPSLKFFYKVKVNDYFFNFEN